MGAGMGDPEVWEALRSMAREWVLSFRALLDEVLRIFGPLTDHTQRILRRDMASAPRYRPPTRPRPAAPWELRPQLESAAPMTSWQRCPERHRMRESRQRWQREAL